MHVHLEESAQLTCPLTAKSEILMWLARACEASIRAQASQEKARWIANTLPKVNNNANLMGLANTIDDCNRRKKKLQRKLAVICDHLRTYLQKHS